MIQRPAWASHMSRQGIVMPSEQFTKYKLMMLFSPLLLIGAILVWIYFAKRMKKMAAQEGVLFKLNFWPAIGTDGGGGDLPATAAAAISTYLTLLPTDSHVGGHKYEFKRTRCSELDLVGRYVLRGWTGEGVALQPEVRLGS